MDRPVKAYIGLGSNQGDSPAAFRQAIEVLKQNERVFSARSSSFIKTSAAGPVQQNEFLNAVAEVETTLPPHSLLSILQETESYFGRQRDQKWGPRTLDLDLLLYEDEVMNGPDLILPHPQMHLRSFVLRGMCELVPDALHPVMGQTMKQLARRLNGGNFWLNPKKPQLISLTGVIGVGKSTLAERLAGVLGAKMVCEEYDKNPYLDQVYEGRTDLALDSELFFLSSSAAQLKQKCLRQGTVYVSDYVFEKARIYARQWLTPQDLEQYQKMYEAVKAQVHPPVLVVYIEDTIENCLQRIRQRQRPYEQDIEPAFLEALKSGYDQLYHNWQESPVIRIQAADCFEIEQIKELAEQVSFYICTE